LSKVSLRNDSLTEMLNGVIALEKVAAKGRLRSEEVKIVEFSSCFARVGIFVDAPAQLTDKSRRGSTALGHRVRDISKIWKDSGCNCKEALLGTGDAPSRRNEHGSISTFFSSTGPAMARIW